MHQFITVVEINSELGTMCGILFNDWIVVDRILICFTSPSVLPTETLSPTFICRSKRRTKQLNWIIVHELQFYV